MPRVKLFNEKEALTKAMNLFWRQGYAATSVQDIVKHLGINRASLYDTFGDKDQLFKKSFELYRKNNIEGLTHFFKSRPNVKKGFTELFEIAIQEAISDIDNKGCFVVNTTAELIPNDESLLIILENNKRDIERIFLDYLTEGQLNDQLKTNQSLKSLASLFYTLYNGLRLVAKVSPDKKDLSDSINVALSLLV